MNRESKMSTFATSKISRTQAFLLEDSLDFLANRSKGAVQAGTVSASRREKIQNNSRASAVLLALQVGRLMRQEACG